MNREAAAQALSVAQKHLANNNFPSAIRFAKKSITLESTPEAEAFLAKAERLAAADGPSASAAPSSSSAAQSAPRASTSGVDPSPSGSASGTRQRKAGTDGGANEGREWTPAQAAVVKRVKACRVTAYYEILDVEKKCTDGEIKKAYRKLALGLHPDKNLAPGAEEAFKMVSKAFQVLSDSNKRAIYDQTGGDPDSRGGGGGGGGGGFARSSGGGPAFQGGFGGGAEEMSPEDLFRFFFGQGGPAGGGFGGGPFGGGPFGGGGGSFHFYGPGGVRMQGGGAPRAQARPAGPATPQSSAQTLLQLAPLLLLFLFSLLSQLPSLLGTSAPPDPEFSFDVTNQFSIPRQTTELGVKYFVNPDQFGQHPIYDSFVRANPDLGFSSSHAPDTKPYRRDLAEHLRHSAATAPDSVEQGSAQSEAQRPPKQFKVPSSLLSFERNVERSFINRLQNYCRHEINMRQEKLERARGFLGIGTDYDKIREITNQKLEHCELLSQYGYSVRY
ncbi:hypothetical protein JCM1841_002809 [Sporobolomyces salmonicolor]